MEITDLIKQIAFDAEFVLFESYLSESPLAFARKMHERPVFTGFAKSFLQKVLAIHLETMEGFLEAMAQHHIQKIEYADPPTYFNDKLTSVEEDPEEQFWHSDLAASMITHYSNLLRSSLFVSLYSFFESRLVNECRDRKNEHTPLSFSDIAGQNAIDKAKTYFTKVLQVNFPSNTTEWREIHNYRLLRNCIVHNRGSLDEMRDTKLLREYIASNNSLHLVDDEILLEKGFCKEACETMKIFMRQLFSEGSNARR
jgi:hypothetical protein